MATDKLATLKKLFDRFDRDHSGFIDASELGQLLEAHGSGSDERFLEALASLKTKQKGRISWDEFRVWWSGVASAPRRAKAAAASDERSEEAPSAVEGEHAESDLREVFDRFDRDRSGTMDARELAELFEALGEEPDDEEIAAAMKRLDTDKSGRISFEELAAWWNDR